MVASPSVVEPGSADLARLLVAVGRSDAVAFAALYDALAPRVLGLALRLLGDPRRAEEVTGQVMLEVWRSASHFDPSRGSALAWAMATAHRLAVERLRADGPGRDLADDRGLAPDASPAPSRRRAHPALDSLPHAEREAVELAYYGGRTHAEVARLTRAPAGATPARMRDGLVQLRGLPTLPVVGTA